jgi:hypothetical protein
LGGFFAWRDQDNFQIQDTHLEWLLDTGKELERACEFSMALKYYFAGKVYFAKRQIHQNLSPKQKQLMDEFHQMYRDLLPMTNAEVIFFAAAVTRLPVFFLIFLFCPIMIFLSSNQAYASARESVHYQSVVLKRGTMSK